MTRAATTLLLAFVLSACAGTRARTSVLVPAMQQAWPRIEALALLGAQDVTAVERFGAALSTGDMDVIASVPFEPVRLFALQGIQIRLMDGTLGPIGAGSYRENVRLFNESYLKLKGL